VTTARPIQATLSLHPPEAGAPRLLLELLARNGVAVSGAPAGTGAPAVAAAKEGSEDAPSIVVFDGKLKPEHSGLVRGPGGRYLLAGAGPERQPHGEDLAVLAGLLKGASLAPDFDGVQRYYVGTLAGLRTASERVHAHLEALGVPRGAAEAAADVLYELAANALLDAPAGEGGTPKYAHRRDDPGLQISPEDAAVIAFGVKGTRAYLVATDRFGRLTSEPFARTLEGLGARAKVNDAGGGAGLGLRRIVEQSDLIAVRVVPGRLTEVLCTVDLGEIRRRASGSKSLFFSIERG
jgi:hypothetical protein